MRTTCFAILALGACAAAPPQPVTNREPPLPEPMLLAALNPSGNNEGGSRSQYLTMLGREDLAGTVDPPACAPLTRDGAPVDALAEIARRAADARIVIVNEAHDAPYHRAFIGDVAVRLRAQGFSIYAAETFSVLATAPRAWTSMNDGFYSAEPAFGDTLRSARALGYRFIHYEHEERPDESATWPQRIAAREAGEVRNLVERVLTPYPEARVLIHVGYSHLLEAPDRGGNEWMARRLKQTTGIDPFTIDLTRASAPGDAFVICDVASNNVDLVVGVPRVALERGRPVWRRRAGQHDVEAPAQLLSATEAVILEARIASEPDDAVPVDRLLLQPGETLPLLLRPGRYRVARWSLSGGWSRAVEIDVR